MKRDILEREVDWDEDVELMIDVQSLDGHRW
jgi:hypothetical protein